MSGVSREWPAGARPPPDALRAAVRDADPLPVRGRVTRLAGPVLEASGCAARIGDEVEIRTPRRPPLAGEVVGFREGRVVVLPLGEATGVGADAQVLSRGARAALRVGEGLLGRVLDGLGNPADGRALPPGLVRWDIERPAPPPLSRPPVRAPLPLGVRALDGLLTAGEGQRLGLFAGAGVGKSMLLGQIARGTGADRVVACLVGERGREVREFLDGALGPQGLARAVVVAATSDAPPLVRLRAAHTATAVAEWFAEQGHRVLLLVDSITRHARALREVGLAAGEPPARQGYPASVFSALPRLLERAGPRARGSITAVYTVLVAGGDLEEPIADEVRSILDGHVVLDRRLAEAGRFPAVDVLASVSRVMPGVAKPAHRAAAARVRALLAAHARVRDLVALGAYQAGADAEADAALERLPALEAFLRQAPEERSGLDDALARLAEVAA